MDGSHLSKAKGHFFVVRLSSLQCIQNQMVCNFRTAHTQIQYFIELWNSASFQLHISSLSLLALLALFIFSFLSLSLCPTHSSLHFPLMLTVDIKIRFDIIHPFAYTHVYVHFIMLYYIIWYFFLFRLIGNVKKPQIFDICWMCIDFKLEKC